MSALSMTGACCMPCLIRDLPTSLLSTLPSNEFSGHDVDNNFSLILAVLLGRLSKAHFEISSECCAAVIAFGVYEAYRCAMRLATLCRSHLH